MMGLWSYPLLFASTVVVSVSASYNNADNHTVVENGGSACQGCLRNFISTGRCHDLLMGDVYLAADIERCTEDCLPGLLEACLETIPSDLYHCDVCADLFKDEGYCQALSGTNTTNDLEALKQFSIDGCYNYYCKDEIHDICFNFNHAPTCDADLGEINAKALYDFNPELFKSGGAEGIACNPCNAEYLDDRRYIGSGECGLNCKACAEEFHSLGGCKAYMDGTEWKELMDQLPCEQCTATIINECVELLNLDNVNCDACASKFSAAGYCKYLPPPSGVDFTQRWGPIVGLTPEGCYNYYCRENLYEKCLPDDSDIDTDTDTDTDTDPEDFHIDVQHLDDLSLRNLMDDVVGENEIPIDDENRIRDPNVGIDVIFD